ncbi:RtcB family protein [Candidatus Halobeggiatoa sp. HSG11]|nr:RtcB family protein [Candidatus Halobeggiatoa sp. HSG11]
MPIGLVLNKGKVPVKIYTKEVESHALDQLASISKLPFIHSHIAAMPDVHMGIGATIGSVIPTKGAIIPAAVGVDIGCFVGETEIPLFGGTQATLKELAEQGGEHWIYSIDKKQKIVAAKATANLTRKNASLVKIILDNDAKILCTPDHRFMLRDGKWCEAKDLQAKTSLMPFNGCIDESGCWIVKQPIAVQPRPPNKKLQNHSGSLAYGYNHQVESVEFLEQKEDVYCLTVPKYENFALSAGVFVHNCGMNATRLSIKAKDLPDSLKKVRLAIEEAVPVGFAMHKSIQAKNSTIIALNKVLEEQILPKHPAIIKMMKNIYRTWTQQLGSLGGGNHFIEVCLDENQDVWIMLHSGSRGIGNVMGRYFIGLAKKDMEQHITQLPHKDLAYFTEGAKYFNDYVEAVHWAQEYALFNRKEMMSLIIESLRKVFKPFEVTKETINCHHNYVAVEEHFGEQVFLTRKGAIRAGEGELGIIPGSMGAKSYIVRGKGDPDSFCSCSHGAGRKMSRTAAKKQFNHRDMEAQTQGVECRKDKGVVDEIPGAYKSIDEVMQNQSDLVEAVHTLKQVVCVKG